MSPAASPETSPETGPVVRPALDLEAARRSARRFATENAARDHAAAENQGIQALGVPLPGSQERLAYDIQRAVKPDCRTAYQGYGPLAVVPLLIDAVREGGCRWK